MEEIVDPAAGRALAARSHASHQRIHGHVEMQDNRLGQPSFGEKLVEKLGLLDRSRISIQQESVLAIRSRDPLREHLIDQIVADRVRQPAMMDWAVLPNSLACLDLGAQHISSGNGRNLQPICNHSRLRSFAATGRPKEQKNHATSVLVQTTEPCWLGQAAADPRDGGKIITILTHLGGPMW